MARLHAFVVSVALGACSGDPSAAPANAGAGAAGSPTTGGAADGGSAAAGAPTSGGATGGVSVGGALSGGGGSSGSAMAGQAAQSGGAGGAGGAITNDGTLSVSTTDVLWTAVRYYPSGTGVANRTSGPKQGPEKNLTLHNSGVAPLDVTLSLTGPDAARLSIASPSAPALTIAPGADATVTLRLATETSALGKAPSQDDGATVLNATLLVSAGSAMLSVRQYALVLTYVELEPTFGQILRGFPGYTSKLPSWLPDDANPNPGSPLPGVVPSTDEVNAPTFERLDPTKPVTFRPLARFSPPGVVPFGWYTAGNIAGRTTVASMIEQADAQTNDKSRLLEPPLAAEGSASFEPKSAKFGLWMAPAGVGLLGSIDADCFDGQHRVRTFTLRDAAGVVIPGTFLIGGEEAANGDYQDYVLVVTNVKPSP